MWPHIAKTMKLSILYSTPGNLFKYKRRISYRFADACRSVIYENNTAQVTLKSNNREIVKLILFFSRNYILLKL